MRALLLVALLGLLAGAQAQADWASCTTVSTPCTNLNTICTDLDGGAGTALYCIPDCGDLGLNAKCFDPNVGNSGFPAACLNGPDGLGAVGCTIIDDAQISRMQAVCTTGALCENTDPAGNPNLVCFDANGANDVCPSTEKCIPDSTNNLGVDSYKSYCRAECGPPGPKTGLLSLQCRVWGKNTCWCPDTSIASGFPTDTSCDVMTTPAVGSTTPNTAVVGTWANTYCTPSSDATNIDLFLDGVSAPSCPTVTMTLKATGVSTTVTYEQCRKNGVPICVCSTGACEVFTEPTTGRTVGNGMNTYCGGAI